MVKKRGGRRGKASGTQSEEAPEATPSTLQATPSTSQATPSTSKATPPAQSEPFPKPQEKTAPAPVQEQSTWTRGPPIGVQEPPTQGRGRGSGRAPQEAGRGRGAPRSEAPSFPPFQERSRQETPTQGRGRGRGQAPRGAGRGRGAPQESSRGGTLSPPPFQAQQSAWAGAQPIAVREKPTQGRGRGQSPVQGRGRGGGSPGASEEVPKPQSWGGAKPPQVTSLESLSISGGGDLVPVKPGTKGRKIRIETNHVRLNLGDLKTVYRYDVSIEPEKKPKWMSRRAMELFRKVYFPNNNPSYDGQKLLYSAKKLPLKDDLISGSVNVELDRGDKQEFKIVIKITGTLDLSPLHGLLQKKNIAQEEAYQCVEIVFRQAYTNSFINVGRRFYKPTGNNYPLGSGAVMYLGGYQAAVQGCRPYLNVDVAHKAFTTAAPVLEVLQDMFSSKNRPLDLKRCSLQYWQMEQMNEYLKGLKVNYEIPNHPGSKKAYRVNALAKLPSEEEFQHEGGVINVTEYYRIKWHCNLRFTNLPTLWVGNDKKRICIPMELCDLKEGQPLAGTRMTANQTSQMINYSATPTNERKKKIENVMREANHNANLSIREFGFSIDPKFETLTARVLDPPQLQYSDGRVEPKRGAWWGRRFVRGAQINRWTIVGFGQQRDRVGEGMYELAKMICDFGKSCGMSFAKPEEPFDFIRNDKRSLVDCLSRKKTYDLIVVIIPNIKDAYYLVKQVAELEIGCLTQCIKSDTLSRYKLNESTVKNILLKINCKLNGTNHTLSNVGLITDEPCLVMGADVTHPSPQARTIPSVVAVTASLDLAATKYGICVYLEKPRTEIIQQLEAITLAQLKLREKEPKRIYFYRDGVSDGEFDKVRKVEVAAIKRACQRFRKGYSPRITFLVVQKRHHTRFFPTDQQSSAGDKSNNAPAGTCVDDVITDPTMQNFYLLSHQSIRGVGRPTKYCTLHDENGLSNDDAEMLTYYLCHVFTRCNRAVSYPAPTYYAHLAADRAKGYLYKKNVDLEHLDQRLVEIKKDFASRNPMFFS